MAIDRESRRQVARLLRRFAAGRITNDEYEDAAWAHFGRGDRGVDAVLDASWFLYDDLCEHRLENRFALTREGRREVARWVLFLLSSEEYLWPKQTVWETIGFVLLLPINLLTLGRLGDFIWRIVMQRHGGDLEFWPFHSEAQFKVVASTNPFQS